MTNELEQKLNNLKAYRRDRENLANWVIHQPLLFKSLLRICFQVDQKISYKAAWVLEIVCIQQPTLLVPHFDFFIQEIDKVYKDQAVRPLAKVCEVVLTIHYIKNNLHKHIEITKTQQNKLIEICFDWLISKQKVAVKAYAMQCLYLLGKDFDWIYPELKTILEKEFSNEQPAYKARAKHILKKIAQ